MPCTSVEKGARKRKHWGQRRSTRRGAFDKTNQEGKARDEKIETKGNEGYIGSTGGQDRRRSVGMREVGEWLRVATISRVAVHRRWGAEGLNRIKVRPRDGNPDDGVPPAASQIRP